MQESSSKRNLVITLLILAAVGVAGYMYATRDRSLDSDLLIGIPTDTVTVEGNLLAALNELQVIRLDTSIFDDPVFESLVDIGTRLAEQPSGRPNPFAPIDSSAPSATPAATASTTPAPAR
jgi:hypothetical protein